MPRYIEEEAFVNFVQERFCNGCNNYNGVKCKSCSVDDAISFVESAPTADVVPKSEYIQQIAEKQAAEEAIREIFEEIEDVLNNIGYLDEIDFKALKKKYLPDTNDGDLTAAEAIAKLIFDNYTMSHDLKTAVKLIVGWQEEFGELKDAGIIKGARAIESLTSVHMLTLEKYKDTNVPTKVSSGDICVVCGEHVPEGRQVCGMCEVGQEFLGKRKE